MEPTTPAPTPPQPATHPDIFTAAEAVTYLRLPSLRSFNNHRREFGFKGVRVGGRWLYNRASLDCLKSLMFGEDFEGRKQWERERRRQAAK